MPSSSPCIVVNVNKASCTALIDTGSEASFIKESCYRKLKISKLKQTSQGFHGITGQSLKVLGITAITVKISDAKEVTHNIFVVPDGMFDTDLLLGADLLGRETIM